MIAGISVTLPSLPNSVPLRDVAPALHATSGVVIPLRPSRVVTTQVSQDRKVDIPTLKILISDDEPLALEASIALLGEYLLLGEEHFLPAVNLQSALAVFEQHPTDIRAVLTDIDMPEPYAGLRLHQELRNYFGFTGPIALVSGRTPSDTAIASVLSSDPETKFFSKPVINIKELGDWLRRAWS